MLKVTIELLTAMSLSRSRDHGYYFSHLLKEYFGEDKTTLVYPSLLLFLVERRVVKYCRLIPFRQTSIDDTFEQLSDLLSAIASGIDEAGGPNVGSDALWKCLRAKLLRLKYKLYIQYPPAEIEEAVHKLVTFVEK
jgi:hypothetical protein